MTLNLDGARKVVEDLMISEVTIWRPDPEPTFNHTTGAYTTNDLTLYEGKAIVSASGNPFVDMHGMQFNEKQVYECGIPLGEGVVLRPEDRVRVDTNPDDPSLEGTVLVVIAPIPSTYMAYTRFTAYFDRAAT